MPYLYTTTESPLGPLHLISDQKYLVALSYSMPKTFSQESIPGETPISKLAKIELKRYFNRPNYKFTVPIRLHGSDFQQSVWKQLQKIPYGKTCSYQQLAKAINNPNAMRAVGNANGANNISIIIPCHRVIQSNGKIGGYAGEVWRKQWLLSHEGG